MVLITVKMSAVHRVSMSRVGFQNTSKRGFLVCDIAFQEIFDSLYLETLSISIGSA